MIQFLLDTDHYTLLENGDPAVQLKLAQHGMQSVSVCPITVEESLRGRLAVLARQLVGPRRIVAYELLMRGVQLFQSLPVLTYDASCEAELQALLRARIRIGARDLKIAACATAYRLTLVTPNRRDFGQVPGLTIVDWSV